MRVLKSLLGGLHRNRADGLRFGNIWMGGGIRDAGDSRLAASVRWPSVALAVLLTSALLVSTAIPGFVAFADPPAGTPAQAPAISHQPGDATFAKSAAVRLYVNATSLDGGHLAYQWYRSAMYANPLAGEGDGGVLSEDQKDTIRAAAGAITDANSATLTATAPAAAGYCYYWAEIDNEKDIDSDGDATGAGEVARTESAFALAKVVDRTLPDHLLNGDMEHWTVGTLLKPSESGFPYRDNAKSPNAVPIPSSTNTFVIPLTY